MIGAAVLAAASSLAVIPANAEMPRTINADASFPEGPAMVDGKLYYAEYGGNRISTWDGKDNKVFWKLDGCGPSAVMPWQNGFLVTCYDNGTYVKLSADGKTEKTWDKDDGGAPLLGPNDLTADGKGGAFVTASGPWEPKPIVGKLYHLSADGTLKLAADDLHYANGVQLSGDGKVLYVNESEAGRVIMFDVDKDMTLKNRRLFAKLNVLGEPADVYPDGIKLGPDGKLYVGLYSAPVILVLDADAKIVRRIELPTTATPNLTFTQDGKTIFVMAVDDKTQAPYKGRVFSLPLN
jgi:sugar lactone lactonase YvrE